ncbi:signal peptidase I [Candidatus Pacearchaeota archaeon]|nr:MAG: signal peptidase I [Candidatus Pacearchaeota archaeon]
MKFKKKVKDFFKKIWFLLWKDDSIKGWIFSVIFLLLFIKLIFFPGLSLITGTKLPLAIVESCSMYHQGNLFSNFNDWWQRHFLKYSEININQSEFQKFSFKKGFNKGDILFIIGTPADKLKIGDVIVFQTNKANPIIHRIIKIKKQNNTLIFSTMGDNNNGQLNVEKEINENQIIGRAVFRIAPYLGWGKLIFFEPLRNPSERGFCREN